jgi:hypothetical protein
MTFWVIVAVLVVVGLVAAWWSSGRSRADSSGKYDQAKRSQAEFDRDHGPRNLGGGNVGGGGAHG